MKRYFVFLAIILGMVAPAVSAQTDTPKKKVAVYMTGSNINEAYKKVIGAKLVSAITESGEYAAVERTADFLAALSAESDYQTSGEVRDSQIAALGQKFGVKFVAVADVSEVFDECFIAARLINVETGLVEMAYDTNGPAESMAQLVSLSKNIASGLFNGISSSESVQSAPIHLSLCVTDRKGRVQYITAEQWQNMSDDKKLGYTKKGVVIAEIGEPFLVAMTDVDRALYHSAKSYNLPNVQQASLMTRIRCELDNVLLIFGGDPLLFQKKLSIG